MGSIAYGGAISIHNVLSFLLRFCSGYGIAIPEYRGRIVQHLQANADRAGLVLAVRIAFVLTLLVSLYFCFSKPGPHGCSLYLLGSGLACSGLALSGPLAFPAFSYRYWLRALLILAAFAELAQILPQVPGVADFRDYAVEALSMMLGVLFFFMLGLGNAEDWDDLPIHDRAWHDLH